MPDIENPSTYAEWYWKNSVDAISLRATNIEEALSPHVSSMLNAVEDIKDIPPYISALLNTLKKPTEDRWDEVLVGAVGSMIKPIVDVVSGGQARGLEYGINAKLQNVRITSEIADILFQRKKITEDFWEARHLDSSHSKAEARHYYNASIPYPAIPDIITASRYLGDAANPKQYAQTLFDIPDKDWMVWDWLTYQKFTTEQVLTLHRTKFWDDFNVDTELARLGWRGNDSIALKKLAYELPNAMLMIQGSLVRGMTEETIIDLISRGGIHPDYAHDYLDAVLTKPASIDIISYELRRDPSLSNLSNELKRIGIHDNYHALYKELAYQIPPVADIITMAVREAFTPAIAARFGQYEDLPSEFVEWVGKKGLSKEWAERYWAAHWSLPSPQQGFEMLHRGVIGEGDLDMLMRALDIMPFWRDKLTQIAYRPLTRVDVRRMYALGVIDVSGVRKAYTDLGYNEYNANLMTNFTIKYTEGIQTRSREAKEKAEEREQEAKEKAAQKEREAQEKAAIPKVSEWTTAQTLKFLTTQLIDEERARQEFKLLGYNEERINVYIASVSAAPE